VHSVSNLVLMRRGAMLGFGGGVLLATFLLIGLKIAARLSPPFWFRLAKVCTVIFPTQIFLLPLSDGGSLGTTFLFYGAALLGNGLLYAFLVDLLLVIWACFRYITKWQKAR